MAVALRFSFSLILLLSLGACFRTVLPHVHVSGVQAVYQVQPGDNLYAIARRYGMDYRVLARHNHIRSPYTIYVGQRLYLTRTGPPPSYLPLPMHEQKATPGTATKRRHAEKERKNFPAVSAVHRHRVVRLRWPLRGKITGIFGRKGGRINDGIDISASEGTPVRAAAAGDVVYADNRLAGYGNLIIIRHSRDMFTAYAHNQRNLVRKGSRVKQGDLIARVGHTGHSRRPNLHFEVRRGPTPVNPLAYLPKGK